jgi:lysophospholipase
MTYASLADFAPRFIQTPDGIRLRTAAWSAGAGVLSRGLCVLVSGQTEFMEKYCEVIDELRARGFAVASFDWRGQGGSQRTLADPLKAHVGNFSEYDLDLSAFMEQVAKPLSSTPPLVLAHSMGAHIVLRALHADPALFSAAVMTSPMLGISGRGTPPWLTMLLTNVMNMSKVRADDYVFGMRNRDPLRVIFEKNLVSSDRNRWQRARDLLAKSPDIRLAGPTWGWLKQAYASIAAMQATDYAERIATRALIFGAGHDRIILTASVAAFDKRMPHATYVELEDAEHEILMESDAIRAEFWKQFSAFMAPPV